MRHSSAISSASSSTAFAPRQPGPAFASFSSSSSFSRHNFSHTHTEVEINESSTSSSNSVSSSSNRFPLSSIPVSMFFALQFIITFSPHLATDSQCSPYNILHATSTKSTRSATSSHSCFDTCTRFCPSTSTLDHLFLIFIILSAQLLICT